MPLVCEQGTVVAARYRLERLLGEGGMGAVWAATHLVTRKPVALKFLKGAGASNETTRRRFLREARAASAVHHPNVVQIHDILELDDGAPVMVMDLLVGEALNDRLERKKRLDLAELADIMVPVISAVGTAHAVGIVHRDLKPDNIFLVKQPDGTVDVRVLDFGIAKLTAQDGDAAETAGLTQTGDTLGTPFYMAPEQASAAADIDHRADVWALGVILYQCLSGERPFQGANIFQLITAIMTGEAEPLAKKVPALPAEVAGMVMSMLVKDRAQRLSDLVQVNETLQKHAAVSGSSFGAARRRPLRFDGPRRGLVAASAIAVLLAATVVGYFAWRRRAPLPAPLATATGPASPAASAPAPPAAPAAVVAAPAAIAAPAAVAAPEVKASDPPAHPALAGKKKKGVGHPAAPAGEKAKANEKETEKAQEQDNQRLPGGVPEKAPF